MPEGAPTQAIKRVSRSTNRTENGYTLSSLILCKSLSWDILRAMPKAAIPSTRKEDTVSRCSLLHLWRRAHRRSAALIFREATVFQSACKATKSSLTEKRSPCSAGRRRPTTGRSGSSARRGSSGSPLARKRSEHSGVSGAAREPRGRGSGFRRAGSRIAGLSRLQGRGTGTGGPSSGPGIR